MKRFRLLFICLCVAALAMAMTVVSFGTTYHSYDSFKTGKVVSGPLNVRTEASPKASIRGSLKEDTHVSIKGYAKAKSGKWYRITYSGKKGYIKASYVKVIKKAGYIIYTPKKYGKVTNATLNVRSGPSTGYRCIGALYSGDKRILKGYKTDKRGVKWYRIAYKGKKGYVSSKYVKKISKKEYNKKSSNKGQAVVDYALKFVGRTPYAGGGASLTYGADCSGFVMAIYKHFGISLPHSSWGIESCGRSVGRTIGNAKPGDVICTNGHVGIYIGNGKMVHARQPGERVRVDRIGTGSHTAYNGKSVQSIRRLVK